MQSPSDLIEAYRYKSDGEMLQLAREGGFSAAAKPIFDAEMARRNLTPEVANAFDEEQDHYEQSRKWTDPNRMSVVSFRSATIVGFCVLGKAYLSDEDRAQDIRVRTKWLIILGLPIPLASFRYEYKARKIGQIAYTQVKILDRVPLNWRQVILTYLKMLVGAAAVIGGVLLWELLRTRFHW